MEEKTSTNALNTPKARKESKSKNKKIKDNKVTDSTPKKEIFNEDIRLSYFQKPDNTRSRSLKFLLDFIVIVFVVMYAFILTFTVQSKQNNGVPTFLSNSYYEFSTIPQELNTSKPLAVFDTKADYKVGDVVGYVDYNSSTGDMEVMVGKIADQNASSVEIAGKNTISRNSIFGVYDKSIDRTFLYSMMTDKNTYIYWCVFPIIIFFIISSCCYFVLYPRKVKLAFFEEMFSNDSSSDLKPNMDIKVPAISQVQTAEVDDTIEPYSADEDSKPIPGTDIETFYTSTRAKNGELFALVKKYPEQANYLSEYGASDMDIIRMNMVGNSEFNALISMTHREKPMTLEQIVRYISSFDNVYCIKKRGAINWTYKFKSKTIMIVRGSNNEFKVSFKTYPDAATKLNEVYRALEDSNFPSGPYWFMFNDLKNLSAPVAQWLIKESYKISMFQEKKAELLRNEKSLSDLGIDSAEIKAQIDSGVNVIHYDKFAVVAHKVDKNKVGLTTMLDEDIPGIYTEDYVKEVFYFVNGRDDLAISLLFAKSASEQLTNALCMEIENFCTTAISSNQDVVPALRATTRTAKDAAPVKMIKKTNTKRR